MWIMWATIATKTTGDESYVASHRMEKWPLDLQLQLWLHRRNIHTSAAQLYSSLGYNAAHAFAAKRMPRVPAIDRCLLQVLALSSKPTARYIVAAAVYRRN